MNSSFLSKVSLFNQGLENIPRRKLLITTLNAHCYNIAQKDEVYASSLIKSDVLLPDGISIVFAAGILLGTKLKKIAGADLFYYEMTYLNNFGGKCYFLGSTENTLLKILNRVSKDFPNVKVNWLSPPFREEFSEHDNELMITDINNFEPDVLFVGMTAPKQEKWAYQHFNELKVGHICCIGAVFDFYAGNVKRAPKWMIDLGFEWFYRLIKEPKRLWKRYFIGNTKFIVQIFREKFRINGF
jgi:N-acetylglucosaminyldiphosphoundecaprenol N-acetyl-beta-D-mannosaminyltransferase